MDGPPLSQPAEDIPPIFSKPDGTQWRIFVEAGGIMGRPKLIRTLKKAGAVVCSDPKSSEVILVDSTSPQGRLFIRDWGNDTNKAVLEHSWVKHSITAGRVLDRDEQWGGCLTVDDGLPIVKEEEEYTTHNPLPTPRITPIEVPAPSESRKSSPHAQTSINAIPETSQPPVPSEPLQNGLPYSSDINTPHPSQQLLTHLPPHTMAAMVAQAQQMAQSFPASLPPNMIPNLQFPPGVAVPQAMMLMAMLQQHQGMMNWNGPAPQNFGAPFSNAQVINPMTPGQYLPDSLSALPSANTSYAPNSSFMSNDSTDLPHSPTGIPPSLRRKSPVHSRSTPSSYSGQMRSESPVNPMSSSSTSQSNLPGSAPSLLFRTEQGRELSFFVQVDLSNRSKVVSAIKRNGGKIVTNNITADYSILYSRSKTYDHLLQSTLAAGRPAVGASFVFDSVQQNEVLDSTPYEFGRPTSGLRGKRKRARSEDDDEGDVESPEEKAERRRLEKNRREAERRRGLKDNPTSKETGTPVKETSKRPKAQPSSLSTSLSAPEDPSRPRSPTPPPEHTRIRRGTGDNYYLYSEHEFDYCRRYIKVLLERDHRMSNIAISQALFKKMDNHSRASWGAFLIGKTFGAEFDEMRKRASIAYRKREATQAKQQAEAGPSGTRHSPPRHSKPHPPVEDTAPKMSILEKEIEIVARFFATGGGQENTEDNPGDEDIGKVWGRLTNQVQCISANSWEEFYSEHHEEVGKRYSELLNIPAVDATT